MWWIFIILIILCFGIYPIIKSKNKVNDVYNKMLNKRNGKISRMPMDLFPALHILVDNDDAYFSIGAESVIFVVISEKLRNYTEIWVQEMGGVRGVYKSMFKPQVTNNPLFDEKFVLYKTPKDTEILSVKFPPEMQERILQLKEEVLKRAENIFIEVRHVSPNMNWFVVEMKNFFLKQFLLKFTTESVSVYESLIDKCIEIYLTFKKAGP